MRAPTRIDGESPHERLLIMTTSGKRGGYRENAGRKSAFAKTVDKPFAMDFTPDGRRELQRLVKRTRLSRNNVLSHLAIQHAHRLEFDDVPGTVYPGKSQDVLSIRVSPMAAVRLRAARARTGKSYSDLGEALVRRFGQAEKHFPASPSRAKRPSKGRRP